MCSSRVSGTAYRQGNGSTLCSPTEEKILCRSPFRSGLVSPIFAVPSKGKRKIHKKEENRRLLPSCAPPGRRIPARRQRTFCRLVSGIRKVIFYDKSQAKTQTGTASEVGGTKGTALAGRHQGPLAGELFVLRARHSGCCGHFDLCRCFGILLCHRARQPRVTRGHNVGHVPQILHRHLRSVFTRRRRQPSPHFRIRTSLNSSFWTQTAVFCCPPRAYPAAALLRPRMPRRRFPVRKPRFSPAETRFPVSA